MSVTAGNELLVCSSFIYSRLVTDPALIAAYTGRGLVAADQVWEYRAPEAMGEPYIAYQRQSAGDVIGLGGFRIYSVLRYLIRAVGRGEDWDHEDIARRIDALFGNAANISVTDPPGTILSTRRVEPFDLPEDIGGVQYRHLGGIYELAAQAE